MATDNDDAAAPAATIVTVQDMKDHGIASGSDAEKAILVDIAYGAKKFKAMEQDPAFQAKSPDDKVAAIREMMQETIDDKEGANPFVTDKNTKQILKNYANDLIDRSVKLDDDATNNAFGKQVDHGTSVITCLDEVSVVTNKHSMLADGKLSDTVTRAYNSEKNPMGVMQGDPSCLSTDEAALLTTQIDQAKKELTEPEHKYLGVKGKMRDDLNAYLHENDKAFDGVDKDAGFPPDEVNEPKKNDFLGKALKMMGVDSGIAEILQMLMEFFANIMKPQVAASVDTPDAQTPDGKPVPDSLKGLHPSVLAAAGQGHSFSSSHDAANFNTVAVPVAAGAGAQKSTGLVPD